MEHFVTDGCSVNEEEQTILQPTQGCATVSLLWW